MKDINIPLLGLQFFNIVLLVSWILLAILALLRLPKEQLPAGVEIVWVLVILLIPVFGALAFFIVRSRREA